MKFVAVEHSVPFLVTSHDVPKLAAPASLLASDEDTVCDDAALVSERQAPGYEEVSSSSSINTLSIPASGRQASASGSDPLCHLNVPPRS